MPIDALELTHLEFFRSALGEKNHDARLEAIRTVRQDVTAARINELVTLQRFQESKSEEKHPFIDWVAKTAYQRHQAAISQSGLDQRHEKRQERKLNVAETIGDLIVQTVKDREFKGVRSTGGILERVRDLAKGESISGARDLDTLAKTWMTYRGVVHLGMAITYLEENEDQHVHVLHLAEIFRRALGESCPNGTKKPYVPPKERIKFIYASRACGPRFADRGLPFYDE